MTAIEAQLIEQLKKLPPGRLAAWPKSWISWNSWLRARSTPLPRIGSPRGWPGSMP